jgi:hypothetical protein
MMFSRDTLPRLRVTSYHGNLFRRSPCLRSRQAANPGLGLGFAALLAILIFLAAARASPCCRSSGARSRYIGTEPWVGYRFLAEPVIESTDMKTTVEITDDPGSNRRGRP